MANGHGGKRSGAGRPFGSTSERSKAVSEYLDNENHNPVQVLVYVMNDAYHNKDMKLVADCAKALLPYYIPKQRPIDEVELDRPTQITVETSFPVPGQYWRDEKKNRKD